MILGNTIWNFDRVYIMGILNVTPDSFSDGGTHNTLDQALLHAERMIKEGADIIDVGGESTRPGYTQISDAEEIERVMPVIEGLREHFSIPISIDTYKANVARAAIEGGVSLVNDIWGFQYDPAMADLVAAHPRVAACLMHNRKEAIYQDYRRDVRADLEKSLALASAAGVNREQIMIDPGIGFAKTYEQNLSLLKHLEELEVLGYPILLGTSRKSVVGLTLDLPANDRLEGTLATSALGIMKGAKVLRVHDVLAHVRLARMLQAVLESE